MIVMKKIKGFDGHIILLCKNHYVCSSIIEGLRMIWAIRCGYDYDPKETSSDRYIANKLYKLLKELLPERMEYLQERIHDDITCDWRFEPNTTPIQKLIYVYISEISWIQIQEKKGEEWIPIIQLPEPNKEVFNRILRGEGKYEDYWLIEPKTN